MDFIAKAERTLEANAAKPNRVEASFVRVTESTQGSKLVWNEVFTVVRENKLAINDLNLSFGCSCVVGILEQLRDYVSWALHLLKELVPRCRKIRIGFQLFPPGPSLLSCCEEILGRSTTAHVGAHSYVFCHDGGPPRSSISLIL